MTAILDFLTGHDRIDIQDLSAGEEPNPHIDHEPSVDQASSVDVGLTSGPTNGAAIPTVGSSVRDSAGDSQRSIDTHGTRAVATNIHADHVQDDTHLVVVGVDPARPGPATSEPESRAAPPVLADPLLALAADVLDDLERVRIANENRLRQLTRTATDSDGEERGFGLDERHPDVARLAALVDSLKKAEHDAELQLGRTMRRHPLGPWVKEAKGVGIKQGARLLAAIGDPYWNDVHDRPRSVSELWAYVGLHVLPAGHWRCDNHGSIAGGDLAGGNPDQRMIDIQRPTVGVAASRKRGTKANWSATAKSRAYLIACSIVKAGGPYREVYDGGRAKYADAVHGVPCVRCGPAGKPAQPGSLLSAGHQHARALRLVSKTVLRDLWREAKRIHEQS